MFEGGSHVLYYSHLPDVFPSLTLEKGLYFPVKDIFFLFHRKGVCDGTVGRIDLGQKYKSTRNEVYVLIWQSKLNWPKNLIPKLNRATN